MPRSKASLCCILAIVGGTRLSRLGRFELLSLVNMGSSYIDIPQLYAYASLSYMQCDMH